MNMNSLPIEIILNKIIPYTYQPLSDSLLHL